LARSNISIGLLIWLQKLSKLVFFGIAAVVTIASMLTINFVPAEIIDMLSPYLTTLIALFTMVFISDSFHAVTKE